MQINRSSSLFGELFFPVSSVHLIGRRVYDLRLAHQSTRTSHPNIQPVSHLSHPLCIRQVSKIPELFLILDYQADSTPCQATYMSSGFCHFLQHRIRLPRAMSQKCSSQCSSGLSQHQVLFISDLMAGRTRTDEVTAYSRSQGLIIALKASAERLTKAGTGMFTCNIAELLRQPYRAHPSSCASNSSSRLVLIVRS